MARLFRVKCTCGNVANAQPGQICGKCRQPFPFPQGGIIHLYRKGNFVGCAGKLGLYINEQPYGYIANRGLLHIPLPYGTHKLHAAMGLNRRCNDMLITLTPEMPVANLKVALRAGFWSNSFNLEPCTAEEMPQD